MSADQGSLFGDVDGLFAPPMIECTPPELVELVPGDHVAAMRAELDHQAHEELTLAAVEDAETLAPELDPGQAWANAFGPGEDVDAPAVLSGPADEDERAELARELAAFSGLCDESGAMLPGLSIDTPPIVPHIPGRTAAILDRIGRKVANVDRAERIAAEQAERLAELAREHDERYPVDPYDEHPCPTFTENTDHDPWCCVCGWEAEDHETTPCADCDGPMWPGIDHDCAELDHQADEDDDELDPLARLVIIPCSGEKLDHAAPAVELYTGPMFKMSLAAARALTDDRHILILSALHGLIPLDRVTEPYERKMSEPRTAWNACTIGALDVPAHDGPVIALLPIDYDRALRRPMEEGYYWPLVNPLAGSRGVGDHRHILAQIAQTHELPPTPAELVELAEKAGRLIVTGSDYRQTRYEVAADARRCGCGVTLLGYGADITECVLCQRDELTPADDDDADELADEDEADDDGCSDGSPILGPPAPRIPPPALDPGRCAAYRWGFGERAQCTQLPGHRHELDPHTYGDTPRRDSAWRTGSTWGDGFRDDPPTSPDGGCFAYIETRDDRDDNHDRWNRRRDDDPELDPGQRGAYMHRGACTCGWRAELAYEHDERRAYEDAADHAHPGWRELPALAPLPYEPSKKQRAAYDELLARLIPDGWTGPVRHDWRLHRNDACRVSPDRGVVPGRAAGRVDLCACPCHDHDDPGAWHDARGDYGGTAERAEVAELAPALF